MKKYFNFVLFFVICLFVFFPFLANGVSLYTPTPIPDAITQQTDILNKMNEILRYYVYNFLFVIATIFFLLSLYGYLTAQGNPEKIKKVTKQLLFAVIAMIGGLFSFAITKIITSILE